MTNEVFHAEGQTLDTSRPDASEREAAPPSPQSPDAPARVSWQSGLTPEDVEGMSEHDIHKAVKNDALLRAAELADNDAYRQERRDIEDFESDNADFYKPERVKQREERHGKIWEKLSEEAGAKLATDPDVIAERERVAFAEGRADRLFQEYERRAPGLRERSEAVAREYGTLSLTAAHHIKTSDFAPQIIELICDHPEEIAGINAMPEAALHRMVGQLEGALQERERDMDGLPWRRHQSQPAPPPQARIISQAPKPVTTVSGKSHQAGKTPDQMDYDEYVRFRQKQIAAKERNGR